MTAELARACAGELAGLADKILQKIPDTKDWGTLRRFLTDTAKMLRSGNIAAGLAAFQRLLPFVEKAFYHVDRYVKVSDTYQLTETLTEHFLVDEESRNHIEKFLNETKSKMAALKESIEDFGMRLDEALASVIKDQIEISFMTAISFAFQMNRISAQIQYCEYRLQQARGMIDDLDTHVAGKSLVANILQYLCFLGSVVFSATGNLPAGAACLATATASRRSAQGLDGYRQQLKVIDREHQDLQSELSEWHLRFRAEQRNFLLLCGVRYAIIFLIVLTLAFLLLGKAANYLFYAVVTLYLVVKSEQTNGMRYYAGLGVAILAVMMEIQQCHGLVVFNVGAAVFSTFQFLGFLEII